MTVRDVLKNVSNVEGLPDEWQSDDDIKAYKGGETCSRFVTLRFSAEDDSSVTLYADHPMLIPFYDAEVEGMHAEVVDEEFVSLVIWIDMADYAAKKGWLKRNG